MRRGQTRESSRRNACPAASASVTRSVVTDPKAELRDGCEAGLKADGTEASQQILLGFVEIARSALPHGAHVRP